MCNFAPNKKTKQMNKGIELKRAIKRLGLKKIMVARDLTSSRVTLDKRLADGEFNEQQLPVVNGIIAWSKKK